eukprot:2104026-Prymnesium_polylepis.1
MFTMNARTLGTKKNTRFSQSRPRPVARQSSQQASTSAFAQRRRDRYHRVQRHQIALGQPCYCAPRRSP